MMSVGSIYKHTRRNVNLLVAKALTSKDSKQRYGFSERANTFHSQPTLESWIEGQLDPVWVSIQRRREEMKKTLSYEGAVPIFSSNPQPESK